MDHLLDLGFGNRRTMLAASAIVSGEDLTCLTGPGTSSLRVSKSLSLLFDGSLGFIVGIFLTNKGNKWTSSYLTLVNGYA